MSVNERKEKKKIAASDRAGEGGNLGQVWGKFAMGRVND